MKSGIFGFTGEELTNEEYRFFSEVNPLGFILFARNCKTPQQISNLIAQLKSAVARKDVMVLIDQEGGRVSRLKSPLFREFPAANNFTKIANKDFNTGLKACYLNYLLMSHELTKLGINVNCAPVADLLFQETSDVIGDRSFGNNVEIVSILAKECAKGLIDGGVHPIVKHIPGHGRAKVDSHEELPIVNTDLGTLQRTDFQVFKNLNSIKLAMTAHIIYEALDATNPVTISKPAIDYIRDYIGFNGIIMTDDLSMKALTGTMTERVIKSISSGCDIILHCNGNMDEMKEIAYNLPEVNGKIVKFHSKLSLKPKSHNYNQLNDVYLKILDEYNIV